MFILLSWATWILLGFATLALYLIWQDSKSNSQDAKKLPPGPKRWPLIGSLPYIGKYGNIIDALTAIGEEFGSIASMKLGAHEALVISGPENIRRISNSDNFDSRPNFDRFRILFEGDRNNSLAFADYSQNLKKRRQLVMHHAFAKKGSVMFEKLDSIATDKISNLMDELASITSTTSDPVQLKRRLQSISLQIFLKFFCSLDVDSTNQEDFAKVLDAFDTIFTEMNDQCVGDVLPVLMPLCNKSHLHKYGVPVREFMMKHCVEPRLKKYAAEAVDSNNNSVDEEAAQREPEDMLDEFLSNVGKVEDLTIENALFAVEDMLGGSSALASLVFQGMLMLGQNPQVQAKIREEVEQVTNDEPISINQHRLPYAESVIWEITRKISSPLVPHVANQDTTVGEYNVKKGTILFFNNGELNNSEKYWTAPEQFDPSRFMKDGAIHKPDFFFPYGVGRRSCLGFRLVINIGSLIVANMCKSYQIGTIANENYTLTKGSLAVPGEGYKLTLTPANKC